MTPDIFKSFSCQRSIDPSDVTIGTFRCTEEWGMNEDMVFREATYKDEKSRQLQRGILVFQPGIAEFVDSKTGDTRPWKPADILLIGDKVTCAFSLASYNIRTDYKIDDGAYDRSILPCAEVHIFMGDPEKSELESMFNI